MEGIDLVSSVGGGAVAGAVLTLVGKGFDFIKTANERSFSMAMAAIDKKIEANKAADESADAAVKRVPIDAGKWVRRLIIGAMVFSFCVATFIFAWTNIPVAVERTQSAGGWLWGLIPYTTETVVEYVKGFYIPSEFRACFMAIVGFYFGRSAVK